MRAGAYMRGYFRRWALCCCLALAVASPARAQKASTRFQPLLENRQVSVFALNLPPGGRATVFQNTHDIFWIAISPGSTVMADRNGKKTPITFAAGDARYFRSYQTSSITNAGSDDFRGVVIEIRQRGLAAPCDCDGAAASAVCGCPGAIPLPEMWAVAVGLVTIGRATLSAGQSFQRAAERGDMLLVAISPVALRDDAAGRSIRLRQGEVGWIGRGLHNFRNSGVAPARYLTLEF